MKTSKLKYNPINPRKIDEAQLQTLCESIKAFPEMMELRPIIYDPETMRVLGGNQRLTAIRKLGIKEMPDTWAIPADKLTDQQKRRFMLLDNVQAGAWEFELLEAEFADFDFETLGIDIPDIREGDTQEVKAGDKRIPKEITTDIQVGDLFSIRKDGKERHRLLCDDAINKVNIERLMNGEYSDLLFTSPPYSDMRTYEGGKDLEVINLAKFIPAWKDHCEYQAVNLGLQRKDHEIYPYWDEYLKAARSCGYLLLAWNIWAKPNAGSVGNQNAFFPITHEWIFVFGKAFKNIYRTEKRKTKRRNRLVTMRDTDGSMKYHTPGVQLEHSEMGSVLTVPYETGPIRSLHPATFSVDLPAAYIKAMTMHDQIIVDPFMGSGTTMVAADQLGRITYGVELEPRYCQIMINRMILLKPEIEIKINDQCIE